MAPSTNREPVLVLSSICCDSPGFRYSKFSANEESDVDSSFRTYCGYGTTAASSISFFRAAISLVRSWPRGTAFVAELAIAQR